MQCGVQAHLENADARADVDEEVRKDARLLLGRHERATVVIAIVWQRRRRGRVSKSARARESSREEEAAGCASNVLLERLPREKARADPIDTQEHGCGGMRKGARGGNDEKEKSKRSSEAFSLRLSFLPKNAHTRTHTRTYARTHAHTHAHTHKHIRTHRYVLWSTV